MEHFTCARDAATDEFACSRYASGRTRPGWGGQKRRRMALDRDPFPVPQQRAGWIGTAGSEVQAAQCGGFRAAVERGERPSPRHH